MPNMGPLRLPQFLASGSGFSASDFEAIRNLIKVSFGLPTANERAISSSMTRTLHSRAYRQRESVSRKPMKTRCGISAKARYRRFFSAMRRKHASDHRCH